MDPGLAAEVAPMPVAVDRFDPPSPDALRDGLLFVGRFNEQKGVGDLLHAAALQRTRVPVTVVAGGPEAARYHALADSLRIADRVRWMPAATQVELAALYRAARALVVPSRDEGLGLVAVEAALCETPVVAYASGGLVDVVSNEETGLLVPPGDHAALASALDRIASDDALARRLGAAARPPMLTTFSPTAVASRYREIYDRVLGRPVP